jgi:hypothetical protein
LSTSQTPRTARGRSVVYSSLTAADAGQDGQEAGVPGRRVLGLGNADHWTISLRLGTVRGDGPVRNATGPPRRPGRPGGAMRSRDVRRRIQRPALRREKRIAVQSAPWDESAVGDMVGCWLPAAARLKIRRPIHNGSRQVVVPRRRPLLSWAAGKWPVRSVPVEEEDANFVESRCPYCRCC